MISIETEHCLTQKHYFSNDISVAQRYCKLWVVVLYLLTVTTTDLGMNRAGSNRIPKTNGITSLTFLIVSNL